MSRWIRRGPAACPATPGVARASCILLVLLVGLRWTGPDAAALATAAADPSPCVARLAQDAAPSRVALGQVFTATLALALDCPDERLPLALAIVLDRSSSMERGAALERAKEGAVGLVERLEAGRDWGTVISFNQAARVDQHLTDVPRLLRFAIEGLKPGGDTNISAGLAEGRRQLARMTGRAPQPALVLLTDGKNQSGAEAVAREGEALRRVGVYVAAIGLGRDPERAILEAAASSPSDAYFLERPEQLLGVFQTIGERWTQLAVREAAVIHRLPPAFEALGAALPPAEAQPGGGRRWVLPALGAQPLALRLSLRALQSGRHPLSQEAQLSWVDQAGRVGQSAFPVPWVDVLPPGASPEPPPGASPTASPEAPPSPSPTPLGGTNTTTPTRQPPATDEPNPTAEPVASPTALATSPGAGPSATRIPGAPWRSYLPALARHGCAGGEGVERAADLVLVLDSSTTMGDATALGPSRLALAQEAIRLLALATDPAHLRLALVSFDAEARLLADLGGPRADLVAAGLGVALRRGSRIDLGIKAADDLLRRRAASDRSAFVVLISDGLPAGVEPAAVLAAAEGLRAGGATLWSLGLGDAPEAEALLRAMAGPEGRFVAAGDGGALAALLPALGGEASCP